MKLPTFWLSDPELWFFQVEAVFENRAPHVTVDSTKFNYIMAALPQEVLNACRRIIQLLPNTADRFEQLRAALTENYSKIESQHHAELIEFAAGKEPIIDIKPAALMMHVTNLAGNSIEALERAMFLNRLSQEMRTVLSSSPATTNADFAKEANMVLTEYLLARNLSSATNSILSISPEIKPPTEIAMVQQTRSPGPKQGPPPPAVPFLCYVHAQYGQQAYSCRFTRCPMRNQIQHRPPSASGNFKASHQ